MFSRIFTTSWQHMSRTRAASLAIVVILTGLFLTFFLGFFLIQQAEYQRQLVVKKFNYPIFLNSAHTFQDQNVLEFAQQLTTILPHPEEIQYIKKETVLDMQIQRDPSILKILGGENPLNDIIMVPLYGVDLSALLVIVQKHSDLFEAVQSVDDLKQSLTDFEKTLKEIKRLTRMTGIFLSFIGVLMMVLMMVVTRLHIRIFQDEKEVCDLV
jgi:cell division protein FtsX